jgi:catechol 2,3-dioxygenase-like lactoylglutathione lyase family enzyme
MATISEFDHSVIAVNDLILAERFYTRVLGELFPANAEPPTMHTTEEVIRAGRLRQRIAQKDAQSGREEGVTRVPAPHSGVKVGEALIPMFLYTEHVQEPPPEQLRGTPRLAIKVTPELMEQAVEVFRRHKVPFEGPVEHREPSPIARSLYFKDPSSNFLELCCPR